MSKAVTNEEVEDVLSSIRRLVSEDKRPLAGLRNPKPEQVAATPDPVQNDVAADRLVLTPALRVADDAPLPEEDTQPLDLGSVARETWVASDEDDADDALDDDGPMVLFPSNADEVEETNTLDALVQSALKDEAQHTEEFNDHFDGPQDYADSQPSEGAHEDQTHEDQTHEDHAQAAAFMSDDDTLEDGDYGDETYWDVEDAPHADMLVEDAEEDDAPVEAADWDIEDDTPAQIEPVADEMHEDEADDTSVQYDDTSGLDADDSTPEEFFFEADGQGESEPAAQSSTIPLTAKLAALEAAVGEIANDWEPDGDEIETLAASVAPAMAWEDDVPLDGTGAPLHNETPEQVDVTPDAAETVTAAAAPTGSSDDQLMDEETLRDLVSEIVRAELQGALGERITRNVRKLVRREIHRALTAQEME
ncbi:hypothetical protein [uncultured Sulfitobacter sp.]|uniref:hypothetical protein n=1 Tax=uncultured Sulfitobacter sp. TaxID=191468 RepID=UPI00262D0E78|nr:hypothetical protein [uncultured Sulfitobacter sp.]